MLPNRARLTLEDAVQHLYHFCATLPAVPYTDLNPVFNFEEHPLGGDRRSISAKVVLPISVDASVRSACSRSSWISEKMARKDAAFEAYKALYHAGLVNDNLLPLGHVDEGIEVAYSAVEKRPSTVKVSEQVDPWPCVARSWQTSGHIYGSSVKITGQGQVGTDMMMLLPVGMPVIAGPIDLYWDQNTTFQLMIEPETAIFSPTVTASAAQITSLLLKSVFRGRMECRHDFTVQFMPPNGIDHLEWLSMYSGTIKAETLQIQDFSRDIGLVSDLSHNGVLHTFHDITYVSPQNAFPDGTTKALYQNTDSYLLEKMQRQLPEGLPNACLQRDLPDPDKIVLIEAERLPKRADFLHRVPSDNEAYAKQPKLQHLFRKECEIDRLPFSYSRFALFIPSIIHEVHVAMIVEGLCNTILSPLHFNDRSLVTSAISASSARESTDYQRLETLGDSILKSMTSLALMAEHLGYHEGIRMYSWRPYSP